MSGPLLRSGECRKFAPNIFNKTKCTNCFRQKEEHSAEALESNRATRKVAKCGYLFVAPGWDFTNPLNRTKRWQRRWFVLYDDGELSYALDEHPETVPQASIDMNKVLEVADAEDITGNAYSLAITTADKVHFVKGTSREEARWWSDVLSVFPRSKGRPKRNATFPGSQSSSPTILQTPPVRDVPSVSSDLGSRYSGHRLPAGVVWESEDVFPTRDLTTPATDPPHDNRKVYMGSPPTRDKGRSRRVQNREKRGLKTGRSYSEDLTKMLPSWCDKKSSPPAEHPEVSRRLLLEEFESECKLKDIADSLTRPRHHRRLASPAVTPPPSSLEPTRDSDNISHKQVRGDPDGCGLDLSSLRYSPSSERVELPAEVLLNIKKGWLMKQGNDKEWNKHWFVLRGAALLYYRDPSAEDQGILDGVIDLSGVSAVSEVQVARNYGFQMTTWDERSYVLSAVTAGIRANWMCAIRRAAGLDSTTLQMERDGDSILPTPLSGSSIHGGRSVIFSSDDEYRTASEGRRESGEWGDALPPSPPLNRTPISKVKERARWVVHCRGGLRSRTYGSRRSRSSPPTSRRSTLDSVPQEDYLLACDTEETLQPESPSGELQEVKSQLTSVLRELSSAEEELLRLRQRKLDVTGLEKQVEELLQRAEDANKQRAKDAAELDCLKKRYVEEKARWDRDLTSAECELQCGNQRYSQLCAELADNAKLVQRLREELSAADNMTKRLRDELASVTSRLAAGIEENDQLYRRLREFDTGRGTSLPPHPRSRSVDSLSDLTNIQPDLDLSQLDKDRVIEEYSDLRARFEKAVTEIRLMKRELRESHAQTDCLELSLINARQDMKARQTAADSQADLMAARVQDLALKLCTAEKQIRALKQKLSKSEIREKRRSLSLKGRESFTICKELEDKLAELETRITQLTTNNPSSSHLKISSHTKSFPPPSPSAEPSKMSARLRRKSLDSTTGSEPMKVLIRLSSLEAKVAKAAREIIICPASPSPQPSSESITSHDGSQSPVELKLFNGLEGLDEVDGNSQVKQHIYCEIRKMETLLGKKLKEISKKRETLIASDQWTNEERLNLLAEKLAYESVLVGRLHDAVSGSAKDNFSDVERFMSELEIKLSGGKPNLDTSFDYLAKTLTRQLLDQNMQKIKPRKVKEKRKGAESAVMIELNNKKQNLDQKVGVFVDHVVDQLAAAFAIETLGDDSNSGCEERIKDAWAMAQESVNQELIQAEIAQVMSQCSNVYQNKVEEEKDSRFVTLIQDRLSLELWTQSTNEHLHKEMEGAIKQLFQKYQENVNSLKEQNTSPLKTNQEDEESARLLLQRFVDIIAHKALLDAKIKLLQDLDLACTENNVTLTDVLFEESTILAEVQHLFLKYSDELKLGPETSIDDNKVIENMQSLIKEVTILRDCLVEAEQNRRGDLGSEEKPKLLLSNEDSFSTENICEMLKGQLKDLQQFVIKCQDCQRCELLKQELKKRDMQYEEDLQELKMHQDEDMARLKAELEQQKMSLVCQHEAEQALLKERARKLERRLGTLDSEYSQQMENLRAAYHKTLSSTLDRDLPGEENIRQRYQAEIEHLRALCEKGLIGMENSHRRMIAELEEKHRQEAEQLRREKENALAEETQATLSALDAMRKAHEAEVAREVAKFKREFLKTMHGSPDIGALHREHEAEMEEIKKEILSLSEKYSVKCVESAGLEEQLRETNEQLAQAQQHILQLDSRNKQLRAHLMAEANENSSADFIRLEEKTALTTRWRKAGARPATIAAALALIHRRPQSPGAADATVSAPAIQDPSSLRTEETLRHPGCVNRHATPTPPLCSVSGMVAERKKIFEH